MSGNGPHILVVDDQLPNVRLLQEVLARAGYQSVEGVTDSRAVEDLVSARVPDLVLLDLHMPHLDGFAVLDRLAVVRQAEGYLPVVVLTADGDPKARHRALELGATDYLTKPFDITDVVLRCRNLLQTRRLYQELAEQNTALAAGLVASSANLRDSRAAREFARLLLDRLHGLVSLEERAATAAAELRHALAVDAVSLLLFEAGTAMPIAVNVDGASALRVPVGGGQAEHLAARAANGPWAWHAGVEPDIAAPPNGPYDALYYAPLAAGEQLLGVAVAGVRSEPGGATPDAPLDRMVELVGVANAALSEELGRRQEESKARARIIDIVEARAFHPVFQVVVDIRSGSTVGFEALTRFDDGVRPDVRFAEAERLGVGLRLEEATLEAALVDASGLPPGAWLSVNTSPQLILSNGRLTRLVGDATRVIVVEITEHMAVDDYQLLRTALRDLGSRVRTAIDDAGAGFASFRHVIELQPDFVKIDANLVRGIESDASRRALVVGMRYFGQQTGCTLIAEGVETEEERAALESLDITFGQGYLFGRPARLAAESVAS